MALFSKKKVQETLQQQVEKKHTIMIVDDEASNLKALDALLNRQYEVVQARNGKEAIDIIASMEDPNKIHLIISDQRMPGMTGVALFERLNKAMPKTVRILLTAYKDVGDILDSINRAQIYKYLLKPYDRDMLLLTVKRALQLYDTQSELESHRDSLEVLVEERTRALVHQARYSALGTMILGMADRLKNPLNFVNGLSLISCELITELIDHLHDQDGPVTPEIDQLLTDLKENMALVYKNGDRLNTFVESMMLLSREDRVPPMLLNLEETLLENADLAEHRIHATDENFRIQVESHFPEDLPQVMADPQAFSRALSAIFNNSVEALHTCVQTRPNFEPKLMLSASHSRKEIHLHIRDNGTGIRSEHLPEVFSHFFTTKSGEQGHVGLGLGMALDVVREMGGDISVNSQWEQFTEVVIHLPKT